MDMYNPGNNKEVKNNFINEDNNSFYNKWFKPGENNNYSVLIVRGAIWILMLVFSLAGLIVVFKDKYNDREFIIVSSKNGSYVKNNYDNLNSFEDSISAENKDFLNNYAKDENNLLNKLQSQKSTRVIKKNITTDNTLNNTVTEFSNDSVKNSITNDETKISKNSSQELTDSLDSLIQKITNNELTTEIEKPNTISSNKTDNSTPAINLKKVWLVTIYSGTNLSNAKSKWIEIYNNYQHLFKNKKVYFIKTNIPGKGIYYRVSLGDTQINNIKPSFKTSMEASNYCKYLKSNNVSCFITEVEENNLDKTAD